MFCENGYPQTLAIFLQVSPAVREIITFRVLGNILEEAMAADCRDKIRGVWVFIKLCIT